MTFTTWGPYDKKTVPDAEDVDVIAVGFVGPVIPTQFLLESCQTPALDCSRHPAWDVGVVAPGLDLTRILPEGAPVELRLVRDCSDQVNGCTSTLLVRSSSERPAPAALPSGLYLAVSDGAWSARRNEFYAVDRVERHCRNFADTEGCGAHDPPGIYALQFRFTGHDETVTVDMGETVTAPLGAGEVNVRNLRSYTSGRCDDDASWAHVITGVPR
jgi:hypothetical protein